jgi:hypothetical protein
MRVMSKADSFGVIGSGAMSFTRYETSETRVRHSPRHHSWGGRWPAAKLTTLAIMRKNSPYCHPPPTAR